MTPRRRALLFAGAAILLALLAAAPALAAAGGGSSGFGGGGGGGGGRGAGLYIVIQLLVRVAILGHGLGLLVVVGLIVAYFIVANVAPNARAARTEHAAYGRAHGRRTDERHRRATAAAAEAAEDDPAFAAEAIERAARELFGRVQAAWSADDRTALARLVSPGLLREWSLRLDDFARRGWRNRVELESAPRTTLVGLHRSGGATPTATVRLEAALRDYVVDGTGRRISRAGRLTERTRIREFWTVARAGERWTLHRIEQGGEGVYALEERLIASPWADTKALTDAARLETAQTTGDPGAYASASATDAHAAALDLSVVDDRFAPDVIEIAVRRVLDAWAEAVDAGPGALATVATSDAAAALLDSPPRSRLVVRAPRLERTVITRLDAEANPPTVTVEAEILARRYREDRATAALLEGSPARESRFTRRLTFALADVAGRPWRLVAA